VPGFEVFALSECWRSPPVRSHALSRAAGAMAAWPEWSDEQRGAWAERVVARTLGELVAAAIDGLHGDRLDWLADAYRRGRDPRVDMGVSAIMDDRFEGSPLVIILTMAQSAARGARSDPRATAMRIATVAHLIAYVAPDPDSILAAACEIWAGTAAAPAV
jgi:hypothetical protein